jgi:acyl-homoserine lactone acylase PvdQ
VHAWEARTPEQLVEQVTIYRDAWGVPHIDGKDDPATLFGFAYAQAEDYFWQIEDSYIMALGRYAEVNGPKGLNSDVLNRAFEVPQKSREDYEALDPKLKEAISAFTDGLNHYLANHPEVTPRLITKFEPWYMVAYGRHLLLMMGFHYTHLPNSGSAAPGQPPKIYAQRGSNAWAVSGERTASGKAMLMINPHQPWFGFGQFYEAHLRSGEGWDFTGATFFGNPMPALGHNANLGWAFTVNEPDIADVWRETFDDPKNPLNYRYGDGYKTATEWKDTIKVKQGKALADQQYTFRKTHHGPVVSKDSDTQYLTANIGKFNDSLLLRQVLQMVRAKNFDEFYAGMGTLNFQFMNTVYADREGNIFYLYNGVIPRRDPQFNWQQPVDGSDPRTEWQGYHSIEELPQTLNPRSGFVQSCNSTPFTATDDGSPAINDYPAYMVMDKHDDKRRAKVSRYLLRQMDDVTFEQMQEHAFDTTVYWALTEFPRFKLEFADLERSDPTLAAQVKPYFEHLLDWDCRGTLESTQTTLCVHWYEELYGFGYPAETLKPQYVNDPAERFKALITAAGKLKTAFGDWKVPYGDANRIQRHANVADFFEIPFDDAKPSLPCAGIPGPLGVVFANYFTPTIQVPLLRTVKKHFGVVGLTYLSVVEFGDKPRAGSVLQFGQSNDPNSPHFMDQAKLVSERKLKPVLFDWDEIKQTAKASYHPGQEKKGSAQPAGG